MCACVCVCVCVCVRACVVVSTDKILRFINALFIIIKCHSIIRKVSRQHCTYYSIIVNITTSMRISLRSREYHSSIVNITTVLSIPLHPYEYQCIAVNTSLSLQMCCNYHYMIPGTSLKCFCHVTEPLGLASKEHHTRELISARKTSHQHTVTLTHGNSHPACV